MDIKTVIESKVKKVKVLAKKYTDNKKSSIAKLLRHELTTEERKAIKKNELVLKRKGDTSLLQAAMKVKLPVEVSI